MIAHNEKYDAAITGDVRQMVVRAVLEIVSPDLQDTGTGGSAQTAYSKPEQLRQKDKGEPARYATYEAGRWILDGSCNLIPENPNEIPGAVGFVGSAVSDYGDGFSAPVFPAPQYASVKFKGVSTLQACTIIFSDSPFDGFPVDFDVDIMVAGQSAFQKQYKGNKKTMVSVTGFKVFDPDEIRITVTSWSLLGHHMRIMGVIPGLYDTWTDDKLAAVDIQMHGNFACLSIPYNTCTLTLDNVDRRFEPRNKGGIFQSIEDRQRIPLSIGVKAKDGIDYKPAGVFYQYSGGWKTGDNDMTIKWSLVDIVGLLSQREYICPDVLPTTLSGWLSSFVSQLGVNFGDRWHVDSEYSNLPVVANDKKDVEGKKCGDLLRFACMVSGTFPRADAETGDLTAEPLWNQGTKITLDNMEQYPTMSANDDIAVLTFTLYDEQKTVYNVSGTKTASSKTLSVSNPFIHTKEQALTAARQILSQYGGTIIQTVGRGNPVDEIGDVNTVWLDESNATTGRRMDQNFSFANGVMKSCKAKLLQADGGYLFNRYEIIKANGKFNVPDNVSRIRIVLVGGGQGGEPGSHGFSGNPLESPHPGEDGTNGKGGKVFAATINVNPGLAYDVVIGDGGKASDKHGTPGALGGETKFGAYTSEDGQTYEPNYTDIANGNAYGRTGVEKPVDGTGDGGKGGKGGASGSGHLVVKRDENGHQIDAHWEVDSPARPGEPGVDGAGGLCVISWEDTQ